MSLLSTAPILDVTSDKKVALQGVNIEACFYDLLEKVTITQVYKNADTVNIEAIYTFPIPLDAKLLNLDVKIGERQLEGTIIERKEAEEQYEDAVTDGDTAIMLEKLEPGLFTMNLGNLLPEETISISFQYALLHKWQDDTLRFHLPTTISPRYGDPFKAGLEPHQIPEYDLLYENTFSFSMRILGKLKDAFIECPTHQIHISKQLNETCINLAGETALLDRDFILNFKAHHADKNAALVDKDFDDKYVLLSTLTPEFKQKTDDTSKSIKIVIDCSSSMSGDSIAQARKALKMILDSLRPQDFFNIITFGNHYEILFPVQAAVTEQNLFHGRKLLDKLDANMGGTEMGRALTAAFKLSCEKNIPQDILLITDGEIWNSDDILESAVASGHRIFTVGVGSSVSEAFVQNLAQQTGGACELVTPNENMAEKIYRHFKRIYSPVASNVSIRYPFKPVKTVPGSIDTIYSGDTLHLFAQFSQLPTGIVELTAEMSDGSIFRQKAEIEKNTIAEITEFKLPGAIPRMMAGELIKSGAEEDVVELAVKYQLMTEQTNYLVIDVRDIKTEELPKSVKIPTMLSAGWGGVGSVEIADNFVRFDSQMVIDDVKLSYREDHFLADEVNGLFEMHEEEPLVVKSSLFSEKSNIDSEIEQTTIDSFIENLKNELLSGNSIESINKLRYKGLDLKLFYKLKNLVNEGYDESEIVTIFLYLYTKGLPSKNFDKSISRILRKSFNDLERNEELIGLIIQILN